MGKHDKPENREGTVFSWDPPADDFLKARIKELEAECGRLRAELKKAKAELEHANGGIEVLKTYAREQYEAMCAEKDAEIESLRDTIINATTKLRW